MSEYGFVDFVISVVTGGEVVTGLTRLKARTARKMMLNMMSTGIMIKLRKMCRNIVGSLLI